MFADDTLGLASDKNLNSLVDFVNIKLKKIAHVSKTKFIIFHTKRRQINNDIELIYNDNEPRENKPELIKMIERIHSNHPIANLRNTNYLEYT
jgi:hypothetical protein